MEGRWPDRVFPSDEVIDDEKGGKSTQKESRLVSRPSGEEVDGSNGGKPTHKGRVSGRN